jgi:DNA (cytosine-5)-methyltransferase 1
MLALACCGNHNEMVRVMDWLFDGWDLEHIREEAKATHSLDYHYTMRTIAYFAEMGRELVDPAEMARLKQRLEDLRLHKGCTWFWPPEDDGQSQADVLPELETDFIVIDRWTRLRQLINFSDPRFAAPASLAELKPALPVTLPEPDRQQEGTMASDAA